MAEGGVGRPPQLLEAELCLPDRGGCDRGALYADLVLLDGLEGFMSDAVIVVVSVLDGQVVLLKVDVNIGEN